MELIPLHKFTCWLCEEDFYASSPEVNSCEGCYKEGIEIYRQSHCYEESDEDLEFEFDDMDYEGPIYP